METSGAVQGNAIVYRNWLIYKASGVFSLEYEYSHISYTPSIDFDGGDYRHGYASTIEEAKRCIDEYEDTDIQSYRRLLLVLAGCVIFWVVLVLFIWHWVS